MILCEYCFSFLLKLIFMNTASVSWTVEKMTRFVKFHGILGSLNFERISNLRSYPRKKWAQAVLKYCDVPAETRLTVCRRLNIGLARNPVRYQVRIPKRDIPSTISIRKFQSDRFWTEVPKWRIPNRHPLSKFPKRKFLSETFQVAYINRKIPGLSLQTQDPNIKRPRECFKANGFFQILFECSLLGIWVPIFSIFANTSFISIHQHY